MPNPHALEKRIRRHVIGRPHPFFVMTAPGLEETCAAELDRLLPGAQARAAGGGVLFKARLDEAQQANLMLRTAGRILMRIAGFSAVHFSQLEKALAAVAWELYLHRGQPVEVRAAAHKSRLHHTEALAQRVEAAVAERRRAVSFAEAQDPAGSAAQIIYVRGDHDRFTLSLDTSGILLHKRGLKTDVGPAPIRETLASAILYQLGYTGEEPLIDAMCGAGTFSLEAALMACRIPPGWYRPFAFQAWPAFKPRRWEHLRSECALQIRRPAPAPIVANDLNAEACRRLEQGLARCALDESIAVHCRDFFSFGPGQVAPEPGIVVINPPYGRRLGARRESHELFGRVCRHLEKHYQGWRTALIVPPGAAAAVPRGLSARPLVHGGLHLRLYTGTIGG